VIAGPKTALALAAGITVTLSGCVHPTPPRPVLQPIIYKKTALAGQTIRVDFAASINPDCTVREIPTVRIVDPPVNGTTQLKEMEDFTSFPAGNPRSVCNKARSRGLEITYTPNPGYLGNDFVSYETIGNDGYDRTIKVAITVK